MPSYKDLLYNVKDNVATITINRPKQLNAFTGDTMKEMIDALAEAGQDSNAGVVVLTGTGERAFCAGGDVNWEADGGLEEGKFPFNNMIINLDKPVIARVNGYAIGAGNHMAYFCDITVAADSAIFGQNGPRVGSPASGYIVSHLANVVGHKRAREMWMTCRRYSAAEMKEWGLVNSVVPMDKLDEEVRAYCNDFLSLSPTCIKLLKKSFMHHLDPIIGREMTDMVAEYAPDYFQTGEQMEGAKAFLEKRAPDFSPWR